MTTLYLSGPVTGKPNGNREAFEKAQCFYEALGYNVVNPHIIVDRLIALSTENGQPAPTERQILGEELNALSECGAIILLDGWDKSKGSRLEVAFAAGYGIPAFIAYADLRLRIHASIHFEWHTSREELIQVPDIVM